MCPPAFGEACYVGVDVVVPEGENDVTSGDLVVLVVGHQEVSVVVAADVHDTFMTQLGAVVAIDLLPCDAPDLGGREPIEP